ncbi:hypothetical protein AAG570_005075 [Ranatra chinensis]|uniref:Proline-rich transmembrane protein 3/4 domain-containing protein n=1 Tax=Ranatra chinensis TaxID=642074 RepID=A0ABD0XZQ3_9HEMI
MVLYEFCFAGTWLVDDLLRNGSGAGGKWRGGGTGSGGSGGGEDGAAAPGWTSAPGAPPWEAVRSQLKWVFLLHSYGFACSFLVLAFYAFFSVLNIRSLITSRPFMSTINVFLCLLGASRAVSLFIDPYHLKEVLPRAMGVVMWDLGFPSILSAFALVQLALLQLTQLRLGLGVLRKKSFLSLVISLHFTCTIAVDVSLTLHSQLYVVKYVVETIFFVWGLMVCCTFLYAGYRTMQVLKNMPLAMLERDNDVQYKGIMQLAMLAPYNNLASSVAAALVPTLLAPKLAQDTKLPITEPCSSKSEPTKSCMVSNKASVKGSPNGSNDDAKGAGDVQDKRSKKLSWGSDQRCTAQSRLKVSKAEEEVEDATPDTSLLPQVSKSTGADLTLHTILNHIAYVNRATRGGDGGVDTVIGVAAAATGTCRRHRVTQVLRLACATAFLCFALIVAQIAALYAPKGN